MKAKIAAKKIQGMGQEDDTILAHINPQEAIALKAAGGSGKVNPKTGLLSFGYEGDGGAGEGVGGSGANGPDGGQNSDAQDAANLLAFDQSQPSPINGGLGLALSVLGVPIGAFNQINGMMANNRTGAGYGATYSGGTQFGGPVGGGLNMAGNENGFNGYNGPGDSGASGLLGGGTPTAAPVSSGFLPYQRPAFIPKFGKPRGLLQTFPQSRGLLGG